MHKSLRYKYSTRCDGSSTELISLLQLVTIYSIITLYVRCSKLILTYIFTALLLISIIYSCKDYNTIWTLLKKQPNLISHKWKDLQVTTWTITEQLQAPMQKDRYVTITMLTYKDYYLLYILFGVLTIL